MCSSDLQPANQTVTAGGNVTFSVVANGTPAPTYQWNKGGSPISGATNSSYTITAAQSAAAGTYTVVVTNTAGSVTSNAATLTVNAAASAPTISTQPANQTVTAGAAVTFAVVANGTPAPTYQWNKGGSPISGATNASYTINSAATGDAGSYTVVVTNAFGAVTSAPVFLAVEVGYAFTTLAGLADNTGTNDGSGSVARFNTPAGVALDATGNLYVADSVNNLIRRISPDGLTATLTGQAGVSGSADGSGSAAQFNAPYGVALDRTGNVYVADVNNHTIRKISPSGVTTTLAGQAGTFGSADGVGNVARFHYPYGIAVDVSGNVYVADRYNHTIRKISPTGVTITLDRKSTRLNSSH